MKKSKDLKVMRKNRRQFIKSMFIVVGSALAPAVRVNEDTFGRLTPENIPKILKIYTEPLAAQGD